MLALIDAQKFMCDAAVERGVYWFTEWIDVKQKPNVRL